MIVKHGVDEALERRKGDQIKQKSVFRDAVRSSKKYMVHSFGLRWVSLMLIVSVPWSSRPWALLFLTLLAPSETTNKKNGKQPKGRRGRKYSIEYITGQALWYMPSFAPLPIRWVLVRNPAGKYATTAFLCTNLTADLLQILGWFILRWNVEVTCPEARAPLGVETLRQWSGGFYVLHYLTWIKSS